MLAIAYPCLRCGENHTESWHVQHACTCAAIRAGFDPEPIPEGMHHCDCPVTNDHPELAYYGEDE